jgi:hypothetical protein
MKAVHNAKKGWFITSKRIKKGDQDFINDKLYPIIEIHKNGVTVLNEKKEKSIIIFTLPCEHLEDGYEWDLLNNRTEHRHTFPIEPHTQPKLEKENKKVEYSNEASKKVTIENVEKGWEKNFKKQIKGLEEKSENQSLVIENLLAKNESLVADVERYENKLDESYKEQEQLAIHAKTSIFGFSKNIQAILRNTGVLLKEDIEYMEQITIRTFIHQTDSILNPSFNDSNE